MCNSNFYKAVNLSYSHCTTCAIHWLADC